MSTIKASEFISKVANTSNIHKELIFVTYDFPLNDGNEVVKVEIEEKDSSSLHHAITGLKDYPNVTVNVKFKPSTVGLKIAEGKQVVHMWCI